MFHLLQGDSIQTCQGDGTWSGAQPVCVGRFVLEMPVQFSDISSFHASIMNKVGILKTIITGSSLSFLEKLIFC